MDTTDSLDAAVAGLLAGDDSSFRLVYRSLHPLLLRYLSVLVGANDAEDVGSETWAQGFRDLGRFSGDGADFRAWITTIGRNRAMDHLRRQSRQRQTPLDLAQADTVVDRADVMGSVLAGESTGAALALLRMLPRDQAEAVMMRSMLGFDAATAARILGKRPGAVRMAAHRGLRSLAEIVERDPEVVFAAQPV